MASDTITQPGASSADQQRRQYERLLAEASRIKGVSLGKDAWRRLRRNFMAMLCLWTLVILGVLTVLTPLLPLQSPRAIDTDRIFAGPVFSPLMIDALPLPNPTDYEDPANYQEALAAVISEQFGDLNFFNRALIRLRLAIFGSSSLNSVFGTDELGRDVLSRLFWGGRISLLVGLVATLVSLVIGVPYGAISGYFGGQVDNAMMRVVDVLYSIPFIFVVIFLVSILSEESIAADLRQLGIDRITIFYLVVGAIYWLTMARVVRGQVISLKQEQFVEAARTLGSSRWRIIFRHLVPNLLSVIIVYLTLTIPRVMLFEAFLSFLGLGVDPPDVSWGLLANQGLKVINPIKIYWWLVFFPGLALGVTLFALNFLGDGLRDALDPRLKNRS